MPSAAIMRSAGPFTALPAMKGQTAIFGALAAFTAAAIPGIARIGATLTRGLDGAITMRSAAAMASRASGVGRAASTPSKRNSRTSGAQRSFTKYS